MEDFKNILQKLLNYELDNTKDTAKDTALNDIAKAKGYEITKFY